MIFKTPSQLDFLTNPCSSAAVVQAGVSMRRHKTPPRKLAGMPASSQCLTSPVTGCTKTAPPSPGPGSGTLDTQPEESVATRASKSRKTTGMALPAERDPGLSMFMLRLLSGQANDRAPPVERSRILSGQNIQTYVFTEIYIPRLAPVF